MDRYFKNIFSVYRFHFLTAEDNKTGAMRTSGLVVIYPYLMNGTCIMWGAADGGTVVKVLC
jgi:hypothetical protein